MQQWLTKEQFRKCTAVKLPESFDFHDTYDDFIEMQVNNWLVSLIGSSLIAELESALSTNPVSLTVAQGKYMEVVRPFLALAAHAEYVTTANVVWTPTGPRTFNDDGESDPVEREDRDNMSKRFFNRAKVQATRLSQLHKARVRSCNSRKISGSKRPTAKVISAIDHSYFNR